MGDRPLSPARHDSLGSSFRERLRRPGPVAITVGALVLVVVGSVCGWWVGGLAARGVSRTQLARAALMGFVVLVAVASVVAAWRVRRTVDDAETVEAVSAAPLLAHVNVHGDPTVLPTLEPASAAAGGFGPLRSAVSQQIGLPRPLVVVVAGLSADDVAVWVGANLAITLASDGRQVLLVDARIGDRFGQLDDSAPGGPGLAGVLNGSPLAEASSAGPVPGLTVLPPGHPDQRPPAAVLRDRFADRLAASAAQFDVVVALGPPLDGSADSTAMAASGVLVLALPERRVRIRALRTRVAQVRRADVRLLGMVLVSSATPR